MDNTHFLQQLVVSMLCGMAIGFERQWRQHPAGLRSNALICVGATLFVSLSLMQQDASITRIASQVVSGIGFLGAGVILRDGLTVKGITTAATIWCCAAIGALAGFGYLLFAIYGTLAVLFLNFGCHPLSKLIDKHSRRRHRGEVLYRLKLTCPPNWEAPSKVILTQFCNLNPELTLRALSRRVNQTGDEVTLTAEIHAPEPVDQALEDLITRLQVDNLVNELHWERSRLAGE